MEFKGLVADHLALSQNIGCLIGTYTHLSPIHIYKLPSRMPFSGITEIIRKLEIEITRQPIHVYAVAECNPLYHIQSILLKRPSNII
jgi:hypothetical protein